VQNGNDLPYEGLTVPAVATVRTVKVRITGPQSPIRELELFSDVNIQEPTYIASIAADAVFGQVAVDGVIAVGAVNANDPGNDSIENFSSLGPSTIFTDFASQTRILRQSLDVAGIDGVDTLASQSGWVPFSANSQFYGTSAAAPHIAAIVALMRDAATGDALIDFTAALNESATDLGAVGYDNTFGSGRADALAAVYRAFRPPVSPGSHGHQRHRSLQQR
jgi:subtilisin family serine protease